MPKVVWIGGEKRRKAKPVNHLSAVLRGYKLAAGLTSDEIGQRLGCSAQNVRHQMSKPAAQWQIGMLRKYCDAIGCPLEEALQAAAK